MKYPLCHATHGVQKLAKLREKDGNFQAVSYIVLRGLKLPQTNATQTLETFLRDIELPKHATILLTTWNHAKDTIAKYLHRLVAFVTKSNARS